MSGEQTEPKSSEEAFHRLVDSTSALHKESYIKTVEATESRLQTLDIDNIQVPTLLIFGDDDRFTPPEVARKMWERIRGSELALIMATGHTANIEQP